MATSVRLNADTKMIQRMEQDLIAACTAAMESCAVAAKVIGIFALDDLSRELESALDRNTFGIGVGVGYKGAERYVPQTSSDNAPRAVQASNSAGRMVNYLFLTLLAVPSNELCGDEERYDATELLTAMRMHIQGKVVCGDSLGKSWDFVQESPMPNESSPTLMFYAQVWQVAIPSGRIL